MSFIRARNHALLAATLLAMSGAALAKDDVSKQANKVAEEAQDLQQATNTLTEAVTNQNDNRYANTALATGDNESNRNARDEDDGDSGKWGLLGLLGLVGLAGLMRRNRDHHQDLVDRDYDRTTTTDTTAGTRAGTRRRTETDTGTRL